MATLDTIRILIQDTGVPPLLSDEDITAIIEVEPNIYYAASICCSSLAAYFAKKVNLSVDVIEIESSQKFEHYTALAKVYENRAKQGGGVGGSSIVGTGVVVTGVSQSEIANVESDADRVESVFTMDLFDNPETEV